MADHLSVASTGVAPPQHSLRVTFYAAKGGQGCTTTAMAAAVLLSHHDSVDLTAHDPDDAAVLAGRQLDFTDDHLALTPQLRLVVDPRQATAPIVVHDAGTVHDLTDTPLAEPDVPRYLVTRPCFLALRRATNHSIRPTGIILIHEPDRAIAPHDIEAILHRPIVTTIPCTPAIARAVDAALVPAHLPAILQRSLRPLTESLAGPVPLARRAPGSVEREL
jgi:hypothetical protein